MRTGPEAACAPRQLHRIAELIQLLAVEFGLSAFFVGLIAAAVVLAAAGANPVLRGATLIFPPFSRLAIPVEINDLTHTLKTAWWLWRLLVPEHPQSEEFEPWCR